ncbi:MAG: hypothetical protein L0154_02535 [Chloroflexi bacterium]|nr:hypothetical protein [Chloroflexota bacterium]
MATLTLRGYLDQLDTLLEQEALEEVIGHCRHILQYFPKNLNTYRVLGRALLEKARYDEAIQVFPGVLSAVPNDFVAHVGMSQIYEYRGDFKRALWHMERAYEQMPNNSLVVGQIRSLYEQMGKPGPEKVKMTRAALAKQYADSQMYDQAISELRSSLADTPQRIDLKILLARTLWQAGYPIESGEMALEILQVLPDSLEANKLMAQLWIASKRPEDAQPFLKRVEGLAPYESLALIQEATNKKQDIADTAFTLERLDWSSATIGALASESPDWVSKIGDVFDIADNVSLSGTADIESDSSTISPFADMDVPDWFAAGADIGDRPKTGELSAPEDWFTEMSTEVSQTGELRTAEQAAASGEEETGFTDILDEIDAETGEELDALRAATAAPSQDEIAALLAKARGEEIADEPPDWLGASQEEPDWGGEFTPDWFTEADDSERTIGLKDEVKSEDSLERGVSDTEFGALFGEDDTDFATLIGETDDDQEFEALFGGSAQSTSVRDDDLSALLGEEEPQLDTGWLRGDAVETEGETEFASMFEGMSGDEEEEDDLSALLGEEEPQLDTSWLRGDAVETEGETEFASMFEGMSGDEEEEEDLSALFGKEEPQLDTGWLRGDAVETEGETEFASMFEGMSGDEEEEEDLSALFGKEEPQLDTGWLRGDAVEAEGETEFASIFEGMSGDEEEEEDLSALFGKEEPQLDTSWLRGDVVETESQTDFASMFDKGGEFNLEEVEEEEFDVLGVTESSESLPDDYWLSEDAAEEPQEAEEGDFSSLFESEASGMTGFLAGAALDLIDEGEEYEEEPEPLEERQPSLDTSWLTQSTVTEYEARQESLAEEDFDSLFAEEGPGDTSWLTEVESDDDLVQVAEDIAAEPLKDTGELPDWLSVAPQEEEAEPVAEIEPEAEADFDALFAGEGLVDTGLFRGAQTETEVEEIEEEEEFDLNNLFRRDAPALQVDEEQLSDIDMLLRDTEVLSAASLQQAPDADLFFAEDEALIEGDEALASLFGDDEMTEGADAAVSAVLSELFREDEEDTGDIFDIQQRKEPVVAEVDDDELDDIFGSYQAEPEPEIDLDLFKLPEETTDEDELLTDLFAKASLEAANEEDFDFAEFDMATDDEFEDELAGIFDEEIATVSEGKLLEPDLWEEDQVLIQAAEERVGDDELFTAITTGRDMTEVVEDTDLTPEVDWVRRIGDEEMDTGFVEGRDVSPARTPQTRRFIFTEKQPRWMHTVSAVSASTAVLEDRAEEDPFEDFLDFEDFGDDDVLDDDDLDDIFSTDWME